MGSVSAGSGTDLSADVLVLVEQEDLDSESDEVVLDLSGLLLALVKGDDLFEDLEAPHTTRAELLLDQALASTRGGGLNKELLDRKMEVNYVNKWYSG